MQWYVSGGKKFPTETPRIPKDALCSLRSPSPTSKMRKFNQDAPGVKLRGRPKKESSDKRDPKVSVNFTDAEEREVKAKAAAAGVSIAELLEFASSGSPLSVASPILNARRYAN